MNLLDCKPIALAWICVGSCLVAAAPARAATLACSTLTNTAHADYNLDAARGTLSSNAANLRVEELLDPRLSTGDAARTVAQDSLAAVTFTLVNAGNGREAFVLDAKLAGIGASVEGFAVDSDGNGSFDAATDRRFAAGDATPVLAPGASVRLFALVRGTAPGNGTLTVDARAATGSGAPGTDFAGKGDDGACDAVTGATGAVSAATVSLTVAPGSDTSGIQLVKTQAIVAPNGSSLTVKGSTITYTIESRFSGNGVVHDARLADAIPEGTAYAAGSLRLDGATLTDSADADAGSFDGTSIHVALGDVAAPVTRTISFKVVVQ